VQLVHASEQARRCSRLRARADWKVWWASTRRALRARKRTSSWLKVKATQSGDFVVGGYTRGKGSRSPFGALLLGYWEGEKLRYASHVGSGFDDATLALAKKRLEPLRRESCPFAEEPRAA